MATGDKVICPICAEVAVLIKDEQEGLTYNGILECAECEIQMSLITPPTKVDTLTIKYETQPAEGQQEFPFTEEELKIPGSDPK